MVNVLPGCRHLGSLFTVWCVMLRRVRIAAPYIRMAFDDTFAPGGSSMKGMNLSGNPGIVQPMQMPPTFGQPPIPAIHPRLVTLQSTTGPQQPIFTRHSGFPYSVVNTPSS